MTHRVEYLHIPFHVELWPSGTLRSAYVGTQIYITAVLSLEQKLELAAMARKLIVDGDHDE